MSDIHDWEGAIKAPGFREALLAYGLAERQIEEGEGLPEDEDELKYIAAEAIEAGDTEFSLEDTEGERGSTDVPFDSLEETADAILFMAVDQVLRASIAPPQAMFPMSSSRPGPRSSSIWTTPSSSMTRSMSAPKRAW
jgi:hypothetical protein